MQKSLCQINNTSSNHVIYRKTQLQGDGCTQLSIYILSIDWIHLWATPADPGVEALLSGFAELIPNWHVESNLEISQWH